MWRWFGLMRRSRWPGAAGGRAPSTDTHFHARSMGRMHCNHAEPSPDSNGTKSRRACGGAEKARRVSAASVVTVQLALHKLLGELHQQMLGSSILQIAKCA